MIRKAFYFLVAGILFLSCGNKKASRQPVETMDNELTMIVGTYTSGSSKGVYTYRFNQTTGEAKSLSGAEVINPSYLTLTADNKFVYTVSELSDGNEAITAFRLDKEKGTLQKINSVPAMGGAPCYIITDGQHIVTANYSGGSVATFPVATDGSVLPASDVIAYTGSGVDADRQTKPHLHCVRFSPDGKYVLANDLGTDQVYVFEVNQQANTINGEKYIKPVNRLTVQLPPGSGPRHMTFSPNGKQAYLINELSGAVTAFDYNDGLLSEIQSVQADTVGAKGSADIHISPDGKFLYASNRLQADGLAIFRINQADGRLTKAGYQPTAIHPRNFVITPNGKFLLVASRDNNVIEVYERDLRSGLLTNTQKNIRLDKPVCLKFAL